MNTFGGAFYPWLELYGGIKHQLFVHGKDVDTGHWQALKDVPHTQTRELMHVGISLPIGETVESWQSYFNSDSEDGAHHGLNLPWAEDHFQERVAGEPTNPGEQYRNWPWYKSGVDKHRKCRSCGEPMDGHDFGTCRGYFQDGEFSHTYQERFWPKGAGGTDGRRLQRVIGQPMRFLGRDRYAIKEYGPHWGIRYAYGDLNSLLRLLSDEPYTRQAYLPIWFPEDLTAAADEHERVPCSLGYHLMLRDGALHCAYFMRSVDAYRYLTDDLYMAGRLVQWVIEQALKQEHWEGDSGESLWAKVVPGDLSFFASSLHVFQGDMPRLKKDVKRYVEDYHGSE